MIQSEYSNKQQFSVMTNKEKNTQIKTNLINIHKNNQMRQE